LHGNIPLENEWNYIQELCGHFAVAVPSKISTHLIIDFEIFKLKWERHTEFSSYTFIREGIGKEPYKETALAVVPKGWLKSMPGEMLVGVHLSVMNSNDEKDYDSDEILEIFGSHSIVGGKMSNGSATAWTDFRVHSDGFSRILIKNLSMKSHQTGRLLQRLWEIETYRMMSLLAMPLIRDLGDATRTIELKLSENVSKMINMHNSEEEQSLLETLTRLAANVEHLSAETSFRFNASKAYYALVLKRVENLKETNVVGIHRISNFLDRRLSPAMRTIESMDDRISILSRRVNRATNLLQTRINTTLQVQNKELLDSMDQRARFQLRLQETVEGLSVVAISYYALGIINVMLEPIVDYIPDFNITLTTALCAPIVITAVFFSIRRIRKSIK